MEDSVAQSRCPSTSKGRCIWLFGSVLGTAVTLLPESANNLSLAYHAGDPSRYRSSNSSLLFSGDNVRKLPRPRSVLLRG